MLLNKGGNEEIHINQEIISAFQYKRRIEPIPVDHYIPTNPLLG